ncbi:MAG: aminotransferase class I/II-fold pyridoxal phosphate-dependent enzyme [Saprospiraceae bacterium]|nr:aminotransferase class I/II-fold pyridoxal phosphate-dependent enzyme [Saprospiraceae bacterium]
MPQINFKSKLPNTGTSIFSVMSALANTHQAINLSQGFPNFDCDERLKELVFQHLKLGHNQYAPMPGLESLRSRLAQKAQMLYGLGLNADTEITITAGATQAIFTAIATFVNPGDEVIILEPAYDSYRPAILVQGGTPVAIPLHPPGFRPDFDRIKKAISPRTRMLIINSPHNPTGMVWSQQDMEDLANILEDTDVLLLSDEVYEHLTYDGIPHQSVLRFPELYKRSLLTYSFGKTFHSTGWKIGYCIAPAELSAEFRKVHQFNVFSVNTPMQYALADFLESPDVYTGLSAFYQEKRDFFLDALADSPLRPLNCSGTYFQLFDYSAISDLPDLEFAKWLTRELGVASIPLSPFYSAGSDARLLRFCFAKTPDVLQQAAEVLSGLKEHRP